MSSRVGETAPFVFRQLSWKAAAPTINPGVQKPHCNASSAMKAFCTGCNPPAPTPSTVVESFPRDGVGRKQTARNRNAVEQHRAGSADARAAHQLCARENEIVTQDIDQKGLWVVGQGLSTTVDVHCPHTDFPLTWDTTRSGTIAPAIKRRIIRG